MSTLLWVAGMLVAFGIVFETLTGTPLVYGILGGAVIVIVYTTMGGMLAVALTDFFQMMVIAFGLIVLLVDSDGWGAISSQLPEHTFRMYPFEHTSERVAQQSFYLASIGYLAFGMIPVLLGIIGSVTMPGLADSESIVPALAFEHLHPVAIAVFVGAVLAAIMSSCDSALLAAASVISTNLLPLVKPNPSVKLQLQVVRWGILVLGVIAVSFALNAQVVFDTVLDGNLLLLAAVIVPFILGVWWRKANRSGALAAMSMGIVSWLTTSLLYPELPGDLIGLGVSFVTMIIVTPLTQTIDPPRALVDIDGNPIELSDRLGILVSVCLSAFAQHGNALRLRQALLAHA